MSHPTWEVGRMVDRRRLGKTEIEVTPIGLGCMQFGGRGIVERFYAALDDDVVASVVRAALDGGVNWFDTAEMYGRGNSERVLTTSLRDFGVAPGDVVIATKWAPALRTASSILRTVEQRLTSLQGYPIDLHQIHMPQGGFSTIASQVRAMAKLCREGKVSSVGVSNFSARQMETASHVLAAEGLTLASNQIQLSLLHRRAERNGVLATARRLGVTLIAYAPLRSGLLTGKFHEDPERVRSLRIVRKTLGDYSAKAIARTTPLVNELRAIGESYGVSVSQVALSWLIHFYGHTVVAIPGASKPSQAKESAAAMGLRLTDKELSRLDELSRKCGG